MFPVFSEKDILVNIYICIYEIKKRYLLTKDIEKIDIYVEICVYINDKALIVVITKINIYINIEI